MTPHKLPDELTNPIDVTLRDFGELFFPTFRRLGFTANTLTSIGRLFDIAGLYLLYQWNVPGYAISTSIAYFFDVIDGAYARKYDMVSDFGDKLDHYGDNIMFSILVIIVYWRMFKYLDMRYIVGTSVIFAIIVKLLYTHVGCKEIYYTHQTGIKTGTLDNTTDFCPSKDDDMSAVERDLLIYRYFGGGTANIFKILIVWYIHYAIRMQ